MNDHPQPRPSNDGEPPQIPLIDPTANVLSLVKAAIERQDDLRSAEARFNVLEVKRLDDLAAMRHNCDQEILTVHLQSQRDLASAESRRLDLAALAEQRRIDALLTAQKSDVALASEKAAAQAATLAQQVITSAEALRSAAVSAQAATNASIQRLQESLDARLAVLEQSRYQIGGRTEQQRDFRIEQRDDKSGQVALYGLLVAVAGGVVYLFATLLGS